MMYDSGSNVVEIFDTMKTVISNRQMRAKIIDIAAQVKGGEPMFSAFEKHAIFPPFFVKMMRVGEKTNSLSGTLKNVKEFYDTDVESSIERVVSSIKPTMTIIIGLFVSWMASAIFGPIYGNLASLSGGVSQPSTSTAVEK